MTILIWPFALDYFGNNHSQPQSTNTLRVVTYNWLNTNKKVVNFQEWARAEQPDLIAVQEVPPIFWKNYPAISDLFPYSVDQNTGNEIAILSRHPIKNISWVTIEDRKILTAKLEANGVEYNIVVAHPQTVLGDNVWARHNLYLTALPAVIGVTPEKTIVLGDFNATQWNPLLREILDSGNLHGQPELFPHVTRVLFKISGIDIGSAIDHIFVSNDMKISGCKTGPALGSDHLPVVCNVFSN